MVDEKQVIQKAIEYTADLLNESNMPVSQNDVRFWLEERVLHLLNNDFNALVNLLYRIDVYESKAKTCFGKQNREIAECLAELIWERQMEKAKRRYGI